MTNTTANQAQGTASDGPRMIVLHDRWNVVRGSSHFFASYTGAYQASARVSGTPRVIEYSAGYLACGDGWISGSRGGRYEDRGMHIYGRGMKLVQIVDADAMTVRGA